MNMKAIVGAVVLVVLIGGAYMLWGRAGTGGYGPTTQVVVGDGSRSIQQLVEAGSPVVCTFATSTPGATQKGTIYIAGGKVAGDFTVTDATAGNLNAHMILREGKSYTWTSISNQGFTGSVSTSTIGQSQGVTYTAQINYACQAWVADSSKFTLPSTITFK